MSCEGILDCLKLEKSWKIVCLEHKCLSGYINYSFEYGCYLFNHKPEKGGHVTFKNVENDKLCSYRLLDEMDIVSLMNIWTNGSNYYKVTLLICHSIGDGAFCLAIMRKIWSYYCKIVKNYCVKININLYPKSLEDMGKNNCVVNKSVFYPFLGSVKIIKYYKNRGSLSHYYMLFSEEDTGKIIHKCISNKITVHGFMAAAIALFIIKNDYDDNNIISIVNLRQRVKEKISTLEGSNFIGYSGFNLLGMKGENIYCIAKKNNL